MPNQKAHELSLNTANIAIGRTVYLLQTKKPKPIRSLCIQQRLVINIAKTV